ncbi:helix-turn-helix domain-containing protein [Tsukamurella sputi]|uniref:Helix-turn-helix domain-containing protein n=1 Tax=Tsukamurella sputi TaxID=2591848 RepID=A0A5C5RGT9_9ACTN|nr:helix-turn-helix domain-containing protein [Tsukamurella sputi]TWS21834.1 helix-turn-helix domain-containing protein [Tsukamurella sputi]
MTEQRGRTVDSEQLGGVIRAARAEQGLTLAAVSARTGLSPSFLSQLENGRTNTSLRSLQSIADALSTTATDLLARADADDAAVCRAGDPALIVGEGAPSDDTVRVRSLVHGRRALRALEFTGRADDDRDFRHPHDEIMYVVAGTAVVTVGEPPEVEELHPGDSLYITAGLLHRWRGLTDDTKVVLMTVAEDRRINRGR